jgi:hypothetical protein
VQSKDGGHGEQGAAQACAVSSALFVSSAGQPAYTYTDSTQHATELQLGGDVLMLHVHGPFPHFWKTKPGDRPARVGIGQPREVPRPVGGVWAPPRRKLAAVTTRTACSKSP